MVWNSTSPDGPQSVKANVVIQQQNTTYTENTLGNSTNTSKDHFWNIGVNEDGHHRAVQMMDYADTYVGAPADAALAADMDGVVYLKTVAGTIQGFYQNAAGIYQFIPAFLTGSHNVTASYTTVLSVPNNTYGQIFMFQTDNSANCAFGSFKATTSVCQAFCDGQFLGNSSTLTRPLRFGNSDQASGLNFRVRTSDGATGTYQYRIMYWGS